MKRLFTLVLLATVGFVGGARGQWVQTNGPYGKLGDRVTCLNVSGNKLFAGTPEGLFESTDNGETWTRTSLPAGYVRALKKFGENLFVSSNAGIFISNNNGDDWLPLQPPGSLVTDFATNNSNLFAICEFAGIFRSSDSGMSWSAIDEGLPYDTIDKSYPSLTSLVSLNSNLVAASGNNGLFLSTNDGNSWIPTDSGFTYNGASSLAVDGANLFAGTFGAGVFLSTNFGNTWTKTDSDLTYLDITGQDTFIANVSILALIKSGVVLLAGTRQGVFLSTDNGIHWIAVNQGLTGLRLLTVNALTANSTYLFAGVDDSIVRRRPLSDFENSSVSIQQEAESRLSSYPNPFSDHSEISFNSQSASYADISIVNVLGAPVAHLFSGELGAGNHSFAWDAQGAAPGSYWCIVRMGGRVEKVALLRE